MLCDLVVRDILLIEKLELQFAPGLNVLTGETGAGKSILLDCLGFVLGWRGRADVVRAGAQKGEVTAVFELPNDHPAQNVLDDAGIERSSELIIHRTATPDGRKQAFINDRRVSGSVLRELSDEILELHGQHDDKGLFNPKIHQELLDDFANLTATKSQVKEYWRKWQRAEKEYEEALQAISKAKENAEYLAHSLSELDELAVEPDEDAQLDSQRRLMRSSMKIKENIQKSADAVGSGGASGQAADALRWLEDIEEQAEGRLQEPIAVLLRSLNELAEAERAIEDVLRALAFDPIELEQTEERLFSIRAMARKHNVLPEQLPDFTEDIRKKCEAINIGDATLKELEQKVSDAESIFMGSAEALSAKRKHAASRLNARMMEELAPLKMERAEFVTEVTSSVAGPSGIDDVNFLVATNPGAPAGPLAKIASGGEMSRFMLALKVCLTDGGSKTMIFDEIDRGVGGATADAVGRRLANLAETCQVLVVTHSPQVAAFAAQHWRVSKSVSQDITRTDVAQLASDARVDEIARMLAGENISDEARSAARVLLDV